MIGGIAARVGLVALAVLAASWLVYDLQAVSLDAQGRAEAGVASRSSQVDHALSLFARAARGNADPTPRLDQARVLLTLGRNGQAANILSAVVRTNPGNIQAWILLASATAESNPRRAAEANQQLRLLFGHPVGYSAEEGSILTPTGVVELVPGRVAGHVNVVQVIGKVTRFAGWSATLTKQPGGGSSLVPADAILIVSKGRLLASAAPTLVRPDVSQFYGARITRVGFMIDVPTALLEPIGRTADIHVLGSSQGTSSLLPIDCSSELLAFGCGQ